MSTMSDITIGTKVWLTAKSAGKLRYKPTKIEDMHNGWYNLKIDKDDAWQEKDFKVLRYVVGEYVKLDGEITKIKNMSYNKKGDPLYYLECDDGENEYCDADLEPYDGSWPETWIANNDGQSLVLDTDDWDANDGLFIRIDIEGEDDTPVFFVQKNDKEKLIQTLRNMIAEIEKL